MDGWNTRRTLCHAQHFTRLKNLSSNNNASQLPYRLYESCTLKLRCSVWVSQVIKGPIIRWHDVTLAAGCWFLHPINCMNPNDMVGISNQCNEGGHTVQRVLNNIWVLVLILKFMLMDVWTLKGCMFVILMRLALAVSTTVPHHVSYFSDTCSFSCVYSTHPTADTNY